MQKAHHTHCEESRANKHTQHTVEQIPAEIVLVLVCRGIQLSRHNLLLSLGIYGQWLCYMQVLCHMILLKTLRNGVSLEDSVTSLPFHKRFLEAQFDTPASPMLRYIKKKCPKY